MLRLLLRPHKGFAAFCLGLDFGAGEGQGAVLALGGEGHVIRENANHASRWGWVIQRHRACVGTSFYNTRRVQRQRGDGCTSSRVILLTPLWEA